MFDLTFIQQTLVTRDWFSIPVYSAGRVIIEFHFEVDGSGWSRYLIWGYQETLPQIIESIWNYTIEEEQLLIKWNDGTQSTIKYELKFENKTAYNRHGETCYDAILVVSEHLFPKSSGFPNGWLKDYWGKPHNTYVNRD